MPNTAGTTTKVTNNTRYGSRKRYGVAFEPCTPPNREGFRLAVRPAASAWTTGADAVVAVTTA